MLSSDILEQQFGKTKIVILQQDSEHRIINTVAVRTNEILELSVVTFDTQTTPFPDIHARIISGTSMGSAFVDADIPFVRTVRSVTRAKLPPPLQSYFNDQAPATIVDVDIYVGNDAVHYCHILEIYSATVAWPQPPTAIVSSRVQRDLEYIATLLKS